MKKLFYLFMIMTYGLAGAQTLDEYVVIAADSNAALKAKFLEYQAALEQIPQAGALPDPEVSFGYFISPIETRTGAQEARFSAMQMFPWFGTLGAKKDAKTELAKARFEVFEQARKELSFKVKETYYQLYELERSIQTTEKNLEILRTFESLAITKFESGKTGLVDVLRIQLEIAELNNTLLHLRDKRIPLKTAFNQQLNRNSTTEIILPDTMEAIQLAMDKSNVTDSIFANNNELEGIKHHQRAAQHYVRSARRMGAPSFGLGMNYVMIAEREDMAVPDNGKDAIMPMVSVKIPLYRGKYKAMVNQAGMNLMALENMEIEQRNSLQTRLEMAWADYIDAGRRIALYREQIKTAERTQNILTEAYSADGKDFEEILRIQRILLRYELEIAKAVRDQNTAVAKFESLM